jgi:hypothetical protein
MERLALQFFPFPHVFKGQRRTGLLVDWADPCYTCNRQCEISKSTEIELCSYGINYYRIDEDLLIAGVVIRDYSTTTPARRKALRKAKRNAISAADIQSVANRALQNTAELEEQLRRNKDRILDDYRQSAEYKQEVVQLLRPSIEQALSQVHDYRSLIAQIIQNFNVIMQTKFPGKELERQLELATQEEQAIYEAARLMESKLEAALFLMYPERVTASNKLRRFRVHGQFTKYRKIYERAYDQKGLQLLVKGESYAEIRRTPMPLA